MNKHLSIQATFKVHIGGGNGYESQEVEIDGVRTLSDAKNRTRALYPGAKIRSATQIDHLNVNARESYEIKLEERAEKQAQSSARINGQKDADIERASGSSSVSFASSASDSVSGFVDRTGTSVGIAILAVGAVGAWFVWLLLPVATMFGGLIAGYKYSSKYTVNVNFHRRMWLVLGAAILSATGGYMAGDKIHELAGIDYKTGAPTNVISE